MTKSHSVRDLFILHATLHVPACAFVWRRRREGRRVWRREGAISLVTLSNLASHQVVILFFIGHPRRRPLLSFRVCECRCLEEAAERDNLAGDTVETRISKRFLCEVIFMSVFSQKAILGRDRPIPHFTAGLGRPSAQRTRQRKDRRLSRSRWVPLSV